MQLTEERFKTIEHLFPRQRGNVKIDNLTVVNAYLYMMKEGCSWRALPPSYGSWHTIYMRWNRWSKNGVWARVYKGLQDAGIAPVKTSVGGLDSTTVKVHEHGDGALKKTASKPSGARAST